MTNPSVPDRSWDDLLGFLDDNNTGAIIEEDIRALAGYNRPSLYHQMMSDSVTDLGSSSDWKALDTPYEGVRSLKLQTLFAGAPSTWRSTSGILGSSSNGALYVTGGSPDVTPAQDRAFMFSWNIVVSSEWNHSWGITWWKLPAGTAWPVDQDSWPSAISPVLVALFGEPGAYLSSGVSRWVSSSNGGGMCTLSPGDTLVPTLDFYGTYDSTGSNPTGNMSVFNYQVAALGPTGDNEATVGDLSALEQYGGGDLVRRQGAASTGVDVITGDQMERVLVTDGLPDSGLYKGLLVVDTSKSPYELSVYTGSAWNTVKITGA